jgi:hypothetical protein
MCSCFGCYTAEAPPLESLFSAAAVSPGTTSLGFAVECNVIAEPPSFAIFHLSHFADAGLVG